MSRLDDVDFTRLPEPAEHAPGSNGDEPDDDPGQLLPPPTAPLDVARLFVDEHCTDAEGELTLRHWRGEWWRWHGSRWVESERRAVRSDLYDFTAEARYATKAGDVAPWSPSRHKVDDLLDALAAIVFLSESVQPPTWTSGTGPAVVVACANGLLDVMTRQLIGHTPRFFNTTAVPFDYDPDAPDPREWCAFLGELWDDAESIALLQEWFGYVVSGRTDLHKILLMVGPPRSGKGTINRTMGGMIGDDNVAGPTLSSLGNDFGMAPLIGKPLAIVSDARLTGRSSSVTVERFLAISGEDFITENRKYREQWTGQLPCRFVIASNELPHFGDAAGAIVSRFVVLTMTKSWLGREDAELGRRIRGELGGVLSWALDGLERLERQGRFTVTAETDDIVIAMTDLASPVGAFTRERCERDPAGEVRVDELFAAWKEWAEDNNHKPGTKQRFGRDLAAVVAGVRVVQPRDPSSGKQVRHYRAITFK